MKFNTKKVKREISKIDGHYSNGVQYDRKTDTAWVNVVFDKNKIKPEIDQTIHDMFSHMCGELNVSCIGV